MASICDISNVEPAGNICEGDWELSIAGPAGKAFHSNSDRKIESEDISNPFHCTLTGVNLNDSGVWRAKVSACSLPRQNNWQPQVGLELNFSRFTADMYSQTPGATGTVGTPGFQFAAMTVLSGRDVSVYNLTANLMFRCPLWATPELRRGRHWRATSRSGDRRVHVVPNEKSRVVH
jgi:hypothetical protein